jgi:hypothetical protein
MDVAAKKTFRKGIDAGEESLIDNSASLYLE